MNKKEYKIVFSCANPTQKVTTFNYSKIEIYTLAELLKILNSKAVSNGLFLNGHRNQNYLKGMGNIYFLDFDKEPLLNQEPYYLAVEKKLKNMHIAYVSVPSKSADKLTYKRHIAIILSDCITHTKNEYLEFESQILSDLEIDLSQTDDKIMKNRTSHIAPACINQGFKDFDLKSSIYYGNPYVVDTKYIFDFKNNRKDGLTVAKTTLINFTDSIQISIEDAKKIIPKGSKKSCYCPKHKDKTSSATFFHNENGSANLYCHICGNISLESNFYYNPKIVSYSTYDYSIKVINFHNLIPFFGIPSIEKKEYAIWSFKVENINHIYKIMLAKKQLHDDGYKIDINFEKRDPAIRLISTNVLEEYIFNSTLLNVYINFSNQSIYTPSKILYIYAKKYIFKGYINAEVIIWLFYQNFNNMNFETICNYALGYFEYILKTIKEERNIKFQKDKKFPIQLNKVKKDKSFKEREKERIKKIHLRMNNTEKAICKLMNNPEYQRSNDYNKSKIANKLKMNRNTVAKYIKEIKNKHIPSYTAI